MGLDAAHAVAEAIAEAGADQRTTDDEPFPSNEPKYAEWKDKKYGVGNPAYGRRTGQMLSLQSLRGKIDVTPHEVTLAYGTGEAPERSSASGYINDADKAITDKKKAEYNHEKMGRFYKVGKSGRERVVEVMKEALGRAIQEENGS